MVAICFASSTLLDTENKLTRSRYVEIHSFLGLNYSMCPTVAILVASVIFVIKQVITLKSLKQQVQSRTQLMRYYSFSKHTKTNKFMIYVYIIGLSIHHSMYD